MPFLTSLLILIVTARLLGQLSLRFKQPEIVGELLAGVILGSSVLGYVQPTPALSGISELAAFMIVLSAGLEMNFKDVTQALRGRGLRIGILSFVIPLGAGLLVGAAFRLDVMRTLFLGLAVSITALPVAIRILSSLKLMRTAMAKYALGAAILSDIAALLVLGVLLSLPAERTFRAVSLSVLVIGGKLLLLAGLILAVNRHISKMRTGGIHVERIPEKIVERLGSEALFGVVIIFVLGFGSISEMLGFHFVIGAFFGALLIERESFVSSHYSDLEKTINSVTSGFLAPVFFAYLGLQFNVYSMDSPLFVAVVLFASMSSKILSGWAGGRMAGLSPPESLGIGIILNGRGVMGLVIASIAFERGFIAKGMFSTLVLMSMVTTVLVPVLMMRFIVPRLQKNK